jgi:3-hydroxyacyl-[acyl-carrier-protein] dehydratase
MTENSQIINIVDILKKMPHRYPFLLIDRIESYELGKMIVARKNVTINEPFFVGHFPGYPVMPGVLIVEAMAQAAGILSVLTDGDVGEGELYLFAGINNAKFKRQVIPGDSLRIEVKLGKIVRGIAKYEVAVYVDDECASTAEIIVAKRKVND